MEMKNKLLVGFIGVTLITIIILSSIIILSIINSEDNSTLTITEINHSIYNYYEHGATSNDRNSLYIIDVNVENTGNLVADNVKAYFIVERYNMDGSFINKDIYHSYENFSDDLKINPDSNETFTFNIFFREYSGEVFLINIIIQWDDGNHQHFFKIDNGRFDYNGISYGGYIYPRSD